MNDKPSKHAMTVGEKWDRMAAEENPVLAGVVFFTSMLVIIALLFAAPDYANAADLQAGSLQTQSKATKTTYVVHIAKLRTVYSGELLKDEKSKLEKLIKKAADASKVSTAKKASASADKVAKRAKALNKEKARTVKSNKGLYSRWKGYLTKDQQEAVQAKIGKMGKARLADRLHALVAQAKVYFDRAELCTHVNASGWSNAKVSYVAEWGKRVNAYLAGTPMAGTGYLIVKAAYDTDMDPRLYAAISEVESGRGRQPYGSQFNVCGWVWNPPAMYSWEDAAAKWHGYFKKQFGGKRYPLQSMYGYGGYGPSYVNVQMAKI